MLRGLRTVALACAAFLAFPLHAQQNPGPGSQTKLDRYLNSARNKTVRGGSRPAGTGQGGTVQYDRAALRRLRSRINLDPDAPDPTIRVMIRAKPGTTREQLAAVSDSLKIFTQAGDIFTGEIPIRLLSLLEESALIERTSASTLGKALNDRARSAYQNGAVYVGLNAPQTDMFGQGVVVGVVDTGIDFRHPDFLDANSYSRILDLWDQTTGASNPPQNYSYGTKWTKAQIDTQLDVAGCRTNIINCTTVTERDTSGHGTHVAGSAAGDSATYMGIAPQADLIIVKAERASGFYEDDVLNAVGWVFQQAAAAGKAAVVNLSLGWSSGPHDGTSILSTGLAALTGAGKIIVAAAGNSANQAIHDSGSGTHSQVLTAQDTGVSAWGEFWYDTDTNYTARVCLGANCSTYIARGGSEITTLGGVNVETGHDNTSPRCFWFYFPDGVTSGNTITVNFQGGSTRVDGWTDTTLSFNSPDETRHISQPGDSTGVITVGAYSNKNSWPTGSYSVPITEGYVYTYGSRGPTRDGRTKPDIAAPGWGIASSMSQSDSGAPAYQILPGSTHRINQGTSMASPMVTGAVALRLQQNAALTPATALTDLQNTARTDAATGGVPNNDFGWGKVSAEMGLLGTPPVMNSALTLSDAKSITWAWDLYTVNHNAVRVLRAGDNANLSGDLAYNAETWTQQSLTPDTDYSAYVQVYNAQASMNSGTLSRRTLASLPAPLDPTGIGGSAVTANWNANDNPGTVQYYAQRALDSGFTSGVISSGWTAALTYNFTGLAIATQYHFRVKARNSASLETNWTTLPSTFTTINLPTSAAPTGITLDAVTANWGDGGNPGTVEFQAESTLDSGFTMPVGNSDWTPGTSFSFTGLSRSTTYYFHVKARRPDGVETSWVGLPNAVTLAAAPTSAPIGLIGDSSATVNWGANENPAYVLYYAEAAQNSGFTTGLVNSGWKGYLTHTFTGLNANTTYYFRVKARNSSLVETAPTDLPIAATLPRVPVSGAVAGITRSSITFSWGANSNAAGTQYLAQLSLDDFASVDRSSNTRNLSVLFGSGGVGAALSPNTTHYFRVQAIGHSGVGTGYVEKSTATVAAPATAAVPAFSDVVYSVTAHWTPSAACVGYRIEIATAANFGGTLLRLSIDDPAASSREIDILQPNTTYYFRIGAVNSNNLVAYPPFNNFLVIGSTLTGVFTRSSTTVTNTEEMVVQLTPPTQFNAVTFVEVRAPPGSLPGASTLSAIASQSFLYPNENSSQVRLTPIAPDSAVDISAGGVQPTADVIIRMTYDPAELPVGANPDLLVIANFHANLNKWNVLTTEREGNVLTARTRHFSLFAPFLTSFGTALDGMQVYPIPWMPGTGDPLFDRDKLAFSSLPTDAKVRLYTILGEYIRELETGGSPFIYWDGRSYTGSNVGSGTYLAVVTGGGARKVLRVVVVR
ncbi:MAG: hypothetical protein A2X36_07325 [Elusimicrobia bacterium GWA2_69_24]|nr:MAG: hypothetical protein A2X36_07325 [Elusimicrobia bacterium GWA2_69_24]